MLMHSQFYSFFVKSVYKLGDVSLKAFTDETKCVDINGNYCKCTFLIQVGQFQ